MTDKFLRSYNTFLCHCVFAPLALIFCTAFTAANLVYVPAAYVRHLLSLINTVTDSDETMDEFDEKLRRVRTIVLYGFAGPFVHLASVPVDTAVFLYNLYTRPAEADEVEDRGLISQTALE